jgi:hypothetical protein
VRRYSENGAGDREEAFFEACGVGCSTYSASTDRGEFYSEVKSFCNGEEYSLQESEGGVAAERGRESEDLPFEVGDAAEGEHVCLQCEGKGRGPPGGEPLEPFSLKSELRACLGSLLGAVGSALVTGILVHDAITLDLLVLDYLRGLLSKFHCHRREEVLFGVVMLFRFLLLLYITLICGVGARVLVPHLARTRGLYR